MQKKSLSTLMRAIEGHHVPIIVLRFREMNPPARVFQIMIFNFLRCLQITNRSRNRMTILTADPQPS